MEIEIVAAMSDNRVIGENGGLPWSMPADERFLRQHISGAYLLTGRKSFESNQGKTLFNNGRYVIITNQEAYYAGARGVIAHSVEAGIAKAQLAGADRLCVLGGGNIYEQAIHLADRLVLSEIHTEIEAGDAFFPEVDRHIWEEYAREDHPADEDNPYPYSFVFYQRRAQ